MGIMIFTDSIGDEFEIRHIEAISNRRDGSTHYETNDGRWYSKEVLMRDSVNYVDNLEVGDIILYNNMCLLTSKIECFNKALLLEKQEPYDYSKYTIPTKPLPKGL